MRPLDNDASSHWFGGWHNTLRIPSLDTHWSIMFDHLIASDFSDEGHYLTQEEDLERSLVWKVAKYSSKFDLKPPHRRYETLLEKTTRWRKEASRGVHKDGRHLWAGWKVGIDGILRWKVSFHSCQFQNFTESQSLV
jgi:hypothetical protein